MIKSNINFSKPPQKQLNDLLEHYQAGRYVDAEKLSLSITQAFPEHQFAWKVLAVVLKLTGRISESLVASQKSMQLDPLDAEAHNNLGVLLKEQSKLEEAETSLKQAIELKPDYTEAYNNLADLLQKLGRLEDAEARLRQAIELKPDFTRAHFNLGIVLKDQGRLNEAETSYKKAITLKSDNAEAHLNLGVVLKDQGKLNEAETSYKKAMTLKPDYTEAHLNLGVVLKDQGRLNEAEASFRKAITLNPDYKAHFNLGIILNEIGRLEDAEASYRKAITLKPDYTKAHFNLGIILNEIGRVEDAEASYKKAITLNPDYTEAHNNLGNILKDQGRLNEAEASYRKAITLKPDLAEAHNNLGITLKEQGRLKEAESSYTQAITLKPDLAEAHNNLGIALKEQGRLKEACSAYIQAINLNPDFTDAYTNLGLVIKNARFNSSNVKLYPLLIRLLSTGNFARPMDLAPGILSLLKHDPLIKNLLLEKNFATNFKEANSIIGNLDKLTLLHHLMRVCPLPDLQFEKFFVTMRSLLLTNLDNFKTSSELIYFLSTLSLHCFTNEYIYFEKDEETELVKNLETEIMQTISKSEQPEAKKILCLASYRPLHQYNWCQKLEVLDHLKEVKSRLIKEPYTERAIMTEIPMLEEISDNISHKVRTQYEKNPYPRWFKTGIPTKVKSISEICAELNLHLHSKSIKNIIAPAILIAGCGTGRHSIETASHFSDCQVTAVDLSLASLAYAKRKTTELGITNLEYLQADILKLDQLEQKFDIIESVGVLHHMDEPMAGWRVLTELLKPGGLMHIGLYSELARQNIVEVRKEITLMRVGTSASEIRKFRRSLVESNDENHQLLIKSSDFFSLSMLRDLIFHVQEHRFTLLQIKKCLDELGLKFCGFINKDAISNFREVHGEEADIYDLALWHQYEESNPRAFAAMYQFWCQKV